MKRVWNVLIADDEPIIREGIRTAVDWESLRLEVVAEAEDGEEALELALGRAADIMLVDLSMPIMNGLTLIGRIREAKPETKIVIITGHDEFAYAQEAIKLGVDDYILKPVNPAQLTEVLGEVVRKLDAAAESEQLMRNASKQIERNIGLLRERFCIDWVKGDVSAGEIREQLAFLKLPQEAPSAVAVIRWPEKAQGKSVLSERDRQLLLFAVENIAHELLAEAEHVLFRDGSGLIVALVWGKADQTLLGAVEQAARDYLRIHILTSVRPCLPDPESVAAVYAEAKADVNQESRLSPYVRQAKRIIEERYSDPGLSLEGIAQELCVSAVYLSRILKQETSFSFVALLTHTRLTEAIRLLSSTDLSMHEIAERVGYESQHYFSTAFRKAVGMPPNRYRKQTVGG
ncbi:response regulator [Paenibacillus thailandensis]|uniref:Response regulator n=1 Tax=Paenibacillus thailandensis TaxID=393250 RepID=A0ABW5QVY5_9BACL